MNNIITNLSSEWEQCGLVANDTILIHSSLKKTFERYKNNGYEINAQDIFKSFLHLIGTDGTLLFPLFNFDFTTGKSFDIRNTPSQMGLLTEIAREYSSVRTGHPIYSFAAIGKKAKYFENINNKSGYGIDSPFSLLRELDGKIGVLNLEDQNSMTFYHHVEEMHNVDYRFFKNFSADYTDCNGYKSYRTYTLFVRKLENGIKTDVNRMGERLWKKKLYYGFRHNEGTGFRTINTNELYNEVSSVILQKEAINFLYAIEKNEKKESTSIS